MARRVHANLNGEFHNSYNTETPQQDYNYYNSDNLVQESYDYQTNYDYTSQTTSTQDNGYTNSYSNNDMNYYNQSTNQNVYSSATHEQVFTKTSPIIQSSFPSVQMPAHAEQMANNQNYASQYAYNCQTDKSWISAFGSGGFENEPPLLEELGINFSHIKDKTLASLNPFRKLDAGTLNDADLTGPLLFCFLFGTSLLLTGKVHFGYIYGVATLGWLSIFTILNLMTENGVSFYLTASILGYCLLPMVLLSAVAVLLRLRGIIGLILGITSVSWCTFSSSTYFVTAFGMQNQQILIAYPIFLLYSCFALMTIF